MCNPSHMGVAIKIEWRRGRQREMTLCTRTQLHIQIISTQLAPQPGPKSGNADGVDATLSNLLRNPVKRL
jgi:hypothetical protein